MDGKIDACKTRDGDQCGNQTKRIYLNRNWIFQKSEVVDLPHTAVETGYNYIDEKQYQMQSVYDREFFADESWEGQHVLLTFLGAAHDAVVSVNNSVVAKHHCGYTAFTVDIADVISYGEMNEIHVELDSRESLNIPPFGHVIDYMTYQGIYRDVYLEIKPEGYIQDVFVKTCGNAYEAEVILDKVLPGTRISQYVRPMHSVERLTGERAWEDAKWADTKLQSAVQMSRSQESVCQKGIGQAGNGQRNNGMESICQETEIMFELDKQEIDREQFCLQGTPGNITHWDIDHPQLYVLVTQLYQGEQMLDEYRVIFGFRDIEFRADGFYLNGKKTKIRGLNRHQSYAYVGYAMPRSMQIEDARILKEELSLNAVRTSHYPQSQDFIQACDELGLLVFTEMPGWQHIGDEAWQEQAVTNVREMVQQYRNHPSIILWGTRINESPDADELYRKTNTEAKKLDPTRPTGGVRCIKNSHLLEDVYTYNDFSYGFEYVRKKGKTAPLLAGNGIEDRNKVTKHSEKAYLVSEYNGHMYPTKSFDDEEHRLQHALRHARVVNDLAAAEQVAGGFGWCMADYNTHKDFGSGDRICHHGVLDMFRNPKMAAAVYASQGERSDVLEISSSMDIGEHPAGVVGEIYAFTNVDSIRLYKNNRFIKEFICENQEYTALKHPPIELDDLIGNQLVEQEHMSVTDSNAVKQLLQDYAKYGMNLPVKSMLLALRLILFSHFRFADAEQIFQKYVGNWGEESTSYRFEAVRDGQIVKSVTRQAVSKVRLQAIVSSQTLREDHTYDVAAVRIQAVDEWGNILHYYQEPVRLEVTGGVKLIGPDVISLKGGMGGTYVRSDASVGSTGNLQLKAEGCEPVEITFQVYGK